MFSIYSLYRFDRDKIDTSNTKHDRSVTKYYTFLAGKISKFHNLVVR